jgi:hypothetical protein
VHLTRSTELLRTCLDDAIPFWSWTAWGIGCLRTWARAAWLIEKHLPPQAFQSIQKSQCSFEYRFRRCAGNSDKGVESTTVAGTNTSRHVDAVDQYGRRGPASQLFGPKAILILKAVSIIGTLGIGATRMGFHSARFLHLGVELRD